MTILQSTKVASGGTFSRSGAGSHVEFICSSSQYAIVTLTDMYMTNASTPAGANMNIVINSVNVLRAELFGSGSAEAVYVARGSVINTAAGTQTSVPPITLYVPPGQSLTTDIGSNSGGVSIIQGTYTIFENT